MDTLPKEIIYRILLNLDLNFLIKNCLLVNKTWKNEIKRKLFIKDYCQNNIINFPNFNYRSIEMIEHIVYLRTLSQLDKKDYICLRSYGATSTDKTIQHPVFTISHHPFAFWSSAGSSTNESIDILTYGILYDIGIINELRIRFLEAKWIDNNSPIDGYPCFSSNNVKIEIENEKKETIYVSKIFDVKHNDSIQIFEFKSVFVTRGCKIHIHLLGKKEIQLEDNKYYVCINSLGLYGINGISLPYVYKENKFSLLSKENLAENVKKLVLLKHQLFSITDFIFNNQNAIGGENVLQRYLDDFGRGDILE